MRKLLSANLSRLWKNAVFWTTIVCLALLSFITVWLNYTPDKLYGDEIVYVEDVMFNLLPIVAFVSAGFISLFLGTEYDDHTIRNKLVVGHTRKEVYLANGLTCFAASMMQMMLVLLISGIAGWKLYGVFQLQHGQLIWMLFCCVMIAAVYSAIFVSVSMNISSKASSVVITFLLMFALFLTASYISGSVTISINGIQYAHSDDMVRNVTEFVYNLLPTGQVIQINNMELANCRLWPLYSACLLIVTTTIGYGLFKKKDIK